MKSFVLGALRYSGATALERWRSRDALRIVTYHGVDERNDSVMNFDRLQVHPERFQRQIEQLAREYRIVELSSAVRHWLEHGTWPTRSLAITFDDGYLNNLKVAAPILSRVGVHATFFVTSSFIEGRSQPWWYAARAVIARQGGEKAGAQRSAARLEAEWRPLPEEERSERLLKLSGDEHLPDPYYPFMRKEDVAELAGQGFDVQPHGDAHISFRGESIETLGADIERSVTFVRSVTGRAPWGFAYPYGHMPADRAATESIMAEFGLRVALSTVEGNNAADADRWALRRWDLHGGYSVSAASVRVSGVRALIGGRGSA